MKFALLLPFLAIPSLASPAFDTQTVLGDISHSSDVFGDIAIGETEVLNGAEKILGKVEDYIEQWVQDGRDFIKQNGLTYELVTHPLFSEHQLRITQPKICDPSVKQYSGYLDVSTGKHLFFWFFEARNSPESADFIYWTNGGPGCSSSTGLLFELGPCRIADDGKNVTYNNYSWNEFANILFLDQPVGVGYSYSDDGSKVDRSYAAGEDVYIFYQLFFARFPQYASAKFHMAAESYGGTYAPHAASIFRKRNRELDFASVPDLVRINLASVILANGLTDPLSQLPTVPDYACNGPYPMYDDPEGPECTALRSKVPTCERLINACYTFDSRFTCVPASLYCMGQLWGPLQQTGLNLYDVRKKCDTQKDGPLCYRQMGWIETWLNDPSNKATLGADPSRTYQSCNMEVNQAFAMQGDGMRNSAPLLTDLVNEDIRLLVYAGNADAMCSFMSQERWLSNFNSTFRDEFVSAPAIPWITTETGSIAGEVRSAGGDGFTAGNVTFVTVYEAGHMVPYDQPEAAFDLIKRWIANTPLTN